MVLMFHQLISPCAYSLEALIPTKNMRLSSSNINSIDFTFLALTIFFPLLSLFYSLYFIKIKLIIFIFIDTIAI